jgi:UDP-glucuronate 4-epimerase
MNILITGGAGFIGSHLSERLLLENHNVVCIDNFDDFYARKIKEQNISSQLNQPNYKLVEGDIRRFEQLLQLFNEHSFDIVYHIAARAGVRPSIQDPLLYEDVNIKGTLNLLECIRQHPVKQFIFASSSSVYGINSKVPFSETDSVDLPISPYAATKRACELFCYTYHHLYQIPVSCLRFFTVYGPRQRPEMAIHKFVKAIINEEEITLYGDGSSKRDYTFVEDIVSGLIALKDIKVGFEIFNLGNSNVVSLKELISVIENATGKAAKINWMPDQPGDVPITYSDISKAADFFGYNPKTNIEQGIKKFVQWYNETNA